MDLISEFARVQVERDESGNGPRLMIRDLRTGMTVYLDPLELETLAWMRHEDLTEFLDPSFRRWRDAQQDALDELLRDPSRIARR